MGETMIRSHLVSELSERLMLREKLCQEVISTIVDEIESALIRGERVEIRGFGVFNLRYRAARMGRNPRTGEKVHVSPRYSVLFRAGKMMRESVDFQRLVDEANKKS
jgi:integration host factor subunit beta